MDSARRSLANVAQLVEQLTRNEQVSGSNPLVGSIFFAFFSWQKPKPSHRVYSVSCGVPHQYLVVFAVMVGSEAQLLYL